MNWIEKYSGNALTIRVSRLLVASEKRKSISEITKQLSVEITEITTRELTKNEFKNLYKRVRTSLLNLERAGEVNYQEEITEKKTVAKKYIYIQ